MFTCLILRGGSLSGFLLFLLFLEFLGVFLELVADFDYLSDIRHRQIRENDRLEKSVSQVKPKSDDSRNEDRNADRQAGRAVF